MRVVKSALLAVVVVTSLFSLSYAATSDRIGGELNNGQTVTLRGNVHRKAQAQYDLGLADPAIRFASMTLLTVPTPAQQKALTQLLTEQQDPKSPNFHHWLTPEQFADRFGLSQNDIQRISTWLKAQGFTNIRAARGRNWITFSGTAGQVQSAFNTAIHKYNVNGEIHIANATSPKIPSALAGIVTGIRGLNDFYLRPRGIKTVRPSYYSSTYQTDFAAPGDIATIYDFKPLYTGGTDGTGEKVAVIGQTDIYLADIADFRTGFGFSSISCTTNTNNLITACNDPHFKYVPVPNAPDPGTPLSGDLSEADLDVEWTGAVARNAQVVYVNAPAVISGGQIVSGGVWDAWYYAVDQNLAPVISLSYGACEFDFPYSVSGSADETELQKANSEGITFVNSSGDSGAAECDDNSTLTSTGLATQGLGVSYPASSPEVTGVGGTAVPLANFTSQYWGTSNGTDGGSALSYVPEQVWNDDAEIAQFCQQNSGNTFCTQGGSQAVSGWVSITSAQTAQEDIGISSTGGGPSNCALQNGSLSACVSGFAQPSWQTVTISGQSSVRFSPDVSFFATPNFPGYIFCTQLSELNISGTGSSCASGIAGAVNDLSVIGGTSVSTPVFAGTVALLNQYLASSGGLGNVNPMLYQLAMTPSNDAFHPVTTGTNNVYCQAGQPSSQPAAIRCPNSGVFGYSASATDATTGYNLVAGLGSVDANNLALAWSASLTSFTTSASALNPTSIVAGNSATSTVTIGSTSGFTGTVSFSCTGLPTGASCSFNPTTVSGTGTTTLTIQTAANMAAVNNATVTVKGASGGQSHTATLSLTVTATTESFTLANSLSGGTLTVSPGQTSGPVNLTITSSTGFIVNSATVLPLTYTCSGLPSESTCIFSPSSSSSQTTVTLTIKTTAPTAKLEQPFGGGSGIFYAALLPSLMGIVLTAGSRKRLRGMRMLGLLVVLGFSTLWLGSCGGNSGGGTKDPGTPTGSYTITVSATTGGGNPITGTTNFTLSVQ
ncbi:MAG TPA: S53 family peptidase [Verrucomicrobiae bacterium]|nr:S53 family peptidase [Verrucomicrobiae bacterium]